MPKNTTAPLFEKFPNIVTDSAELREKLAKDKYAKTSCLFIRTYCSEVQIRTWLQETSPVAWAYIYHDKDTKEDGSLKEPHFHLLCKYDGECRPRYTYLTKVFTDGQTFVQDCKTARASFAYLTHKGHPDKAQYDDGNVVGFNTKLFTETQKQTKEREMERFLDDLKTLPTRELCILYGRDYMRNAKRYRECVADIEYEDLWDDALTLDEDNGATFAGLCEQYGLDYNEYVAEFNAKLASSLCEFLLHTDGIVDVRKIVSWYGSQTELIAQERRAFLNRARVDK